MANAVFTITPSGCQKGSDTLMTSREETRKNSITVPMPAELKAEIVKAAKADGMTMATWVRYKLVNILKEEK